MKPIKFMTSAFNPVAYADLSNYMHNIGERIGSASTRHYMQHRSQNGYTRISQTKSLIIVEWQES